MPAINVNGISGLGTELIIINNATGKIQPLTNAAHFSRVFKTDKSLESPYLFCQNKILSPAVSAY
ncbi:hypothetical protein M2273_001483 [Mucilaginibacter lappiensis]